MNEGLISKRYAKALYEHAAEMGEETLLYHRMQILEALLRKMPDLRKTLRSPMISTKYKTDLLMQATGKNAEQSYLDFIHLVISNHRTEALHMITLSYQMIFRQKKNISVVYLTSTKKISRASLDRIRQLTERRTNSKVEFSTHIDPSIDGGFIFQLDDIRIDASVRGQLNRINRRLAQINKSII